MKIRGGWGTSRSFYNVEIDGSALERTACRVSIGTLYRGGIKFSSLV